MGPLSRELSIWIVGHSFVKWAQVQARSSYFGENLGFDEACFRVTWKGKGGMRWRELLQVLSSMVVAGKCPDVLVLHLGENDLVQETGITLMRAMKRDLQEIRQQWSGCAIVWTEFVPRRVWRDALKPQAVDKARRKINVEMVRFCRQLGIARIRHGDIKYNTPEFFRGDGVHLSRLGMDLYLLELREVLARMLEVRRK